MAKHLPNVLVMGPPHIFSNFTSRCSQSYNNFIFFFASSLTLPQFLSSLNIRSSSVRAILCINTQPVRGPLLRSLPSVGLIITTSLNTDHIDMMECRRLGVRVATVTGYFIEDVADFAVGLMIDVLMRISAANRCVRKMPGSEEPRSVVPASRVGGKRVGILGLGKIGTEVAKRLEPFGCKVMYSSRTKKSSVPYPFYPKAVDLAENSDVLVVCCSLTEETHHIVNRAVMEALGKEGVIVNVGRGSLIDEKELVKRLVNGEIGGAGLDVFENEPYVPKELLCLDNVVLSPHAAAITSESFDHVAELVAATLAAFFENEPSLTHVMQD